MQDQEDQCTPIDDLRQMHQPKDDQFIEVCCRGSEIVGFAAYTCWGDHAHIDIIAVAGEARRSGVATRLVHAALSRARGKLKWECRLEVREDNAPGRRLYERLGFTVRKREEGYYEDGSAALKLSCRLLPADLPRARTALWWYRQSVLPSLQAAGMDKDSAAIEAAKRWRKLQKRGLEGPEKWYAVEDEDMARFAAEAIVAAETLRVAQAAVGGRGNTPLASNGMERSRKSGPNPHRVEELARVCSGFPAPVVKQWQAVFGWDTARVKLPTAAAEKYKSMAQMFTEALSVVSASGGTLGSPGGIVLLHEPGFHHWSEMLRGGGADQFVCFAGEDEVQEAELRRRGDGLKVAARASDDSMACVREGCGGLTLVLLWEGGAASWDAAFGSIVCGVLASPRARRVGDADAGGVKLWLACESSAEPASTLEQVSGLLLRDRGLASRGWSWRVKVTETLTSESVST